MELEFDNRNALAFSELSRLSSAAQRLGSLTPLHLRGQVEPVLGRLGNYGHGAIGGQEVGSCLGGCVGCAGIISRVLVAVVVRVYVGVAVGEEVGVVVGEGLGVIITGLSTIIQTPLKLMGPPILDGLKRRYRKLLLGVGKVCADTINRNAPGYIGIHCSFTMDSGCADIREGGWSSTIFI